MMLSILPHSTTLPRQDTPFLEPKIRELGTISDAVASFTKLTVGSGATSIRLYCTVPTWNSSTDMYLDLYDFQEMKARFLVFIHDLLQSLRSSGIAASYSLAPSSSSLCLVFQKPVDIDALPQLQAARNTLAKEQVSLVDLKSGPCLIIT